jgi:hypothetical protein
MPDAHSIGELASKQRRITPAAADLLREAAAGDRCGIVSWPNKLS